MKMFSSWNTRLCPLTDTYVPLPFHGTHLPPFAALSKLSSIQSRFAGIIGKVEKIKDLCFAVRKEVVSSFIYRIRAGREKGCFYGFCVFDGYLAVFAPKTRFRPLFGVAGGVNSMSNECKAHIEPP